MHNAFLAIDFETANNDPTSACSLGLVRVENEQVTLRKVVLIRPPSEEFIFTYIHGLTWENVQDQPTFGDLWPILAPHFENVDFIAAHNASFDKRVLQSCLAHYGIATAEMNFQCTVVMARKILGLSPLNLKSVCQQLEIELNHHEALSDATACATIVVKAMQKSRAMHHDLGEISG